MTFLELANLIIENKPLHKVKLASSFNNSTKALAEIASVNSWIIENILNGKITDIDNIPDDLE